MLRQKKSLYASSDGERGLYLAYTVAGFFGALLSFMVVNQLVGADEIIRPLGLYDYWSIFSGAVGAASGLYIGRRWLGDPGISGWIKAVIAVPVISFIGSLVGGTLALPLYGTMFGPMALAITFYENPIILVLWIWTILVSHILFAGHRRERDSIFQELTPSET